MEKLLQWRRERCELYVVSAGTTLRTSTVTDPNGRVQSVENVYMAGASLFPTSGCANPTFTIVALSIRRARHLRETVLRCESTGASKLREAR